MWTVTRILSGKAREYLPDSVKHQVLNLRTKMISNVRIFAKLHAKQLWSGPSWLVPQYKRNKRISVNTIA